MDIAALSLVTNQSKVQEAASLAVMKKVMDEAKVAGNAMVEMLDKSVPKVQGVSDPNVGRFLDVLA